MYRIYGDSHGKDQKFLTKEILKYSPNLIGYELLYHSKILGYKNIIAMEFDKNPSSTHPRNPNTEWLFQLSKIIKCDGLIGIDLPHVEGDSLADKFKIRENFMVKRIHYIFNKTTKAIIIVGDTHLRTTSTKELGSPSPIVSEFKDIATIIRSRYGEIK